MNPPENYLLFFLFACHGILKDGQQNIVINEYDPEKEFYKLYGAEYKVRYWAENFPNSYIISIFACCRQLWDDIKMSGHIEKESHDMF